MSDNAIVFNTVRPWLDAKGFTPDRIKTLDSALANYLASGGAPITLPPTIPATSKGLLTARSASEIVGHEAIVQEAYKDSVGVWTWSVGIATTSGYDVLQYKDNPQPLQVCLKAYVELITSKYLPAVIKAFAGHQLTEAQLCAALSFHYNTGAILKASWPKLFLAGEVAKARASIMEWKNPPEIVERRSKERDLFFDGAWTGDGKATVYQVRKPSYTPDWGPAKRVPVLADLQALLS